MGFPSNQIYIYTLPRLKGLHFFVECHGFCSEKKKNEVGIKENNGQWSKKDSLELNCKKYWPPFQEVSNIILQLMGKITEKNFCLNHLSALGSSVSF